jgi:hypothetical protein
MRFVSRHANYTFIARPDKVQMVLTTNGTMTPQTVVAAIQCDFQHGLVRPEEAEMAKQHWLGFGRREDGTAIAYGATPTTVVGVVNGQAHDGWNPDLMFSVFDTDTIPNEEDRTYTEKRLVEDASNGNHYIQVTGKKLDPPWPTYEQMQGKKGQPTSALICNMIREGGYDPDYVIAYELQRERPRYDIPKAIEALKVELAAEAAENASLQREIPA